MRILSNKTFHFTKEDNPDSNLQKGDYIRVKRKMLYWHSAIYIGASQVAHVQGGGFTKTNAVAQIDPWDNFLRDS